MRRFVWQLVVVSSLLGSWGYGATRPQYGGSAHVLLRSALNSLDPAAPQPQAFTAANVLGLVYETLIKIDDNGKPQPGLALSWHAAYDHRHWYFQLRPGVKFDDGTPLTAEVVAASLRQGNTWTVAPQGESIAIGLEQPTAFLVAELALPINAIVKRGEGNPRGTGPFRVADWQPGRRLLLNANEDYWGGRPFLNSVDIEFGKTYRDQEVGLELGRADLVEVAPGQARRMEAAGRHTSESQPLELLALVFARESQSSKDSRLREALRLCIDHQSIRDVLLGTEGVVAGGILPNWISGYEFLFPADTDVSKAQEDRGAVSQAPMWTLAYDPVDSLSPVIAERIVLNARDVGLRMQLATSGNADVQLARIRVQSADAAVALKTLAAQLGLPEPQADNTSTESIYHAENSLLQSQRVIPLFHLPVIYALSPTLRGWRPWRDGRWRLADVWLDTTRGSMQ